MQTTTDRGNRERKDELVRRERLCPFCRYNHNENAGRRARHGHRKTNKRRR